MCEAAGMEFLAEGRTAEVFVWDDERVVKLDRVGWTGLSHYESGVIEVIVAAGVSAPKVFETVWVEGRSGVVLERLEGPQLAERVRAHPALAEQEAVDFVEFHMGLHRPVEGLPDQVDLLRASIERTELASAVKREVLAILNDLDDGKRVLCHGDLTAENVIMTASGPVAIDWLTANAGVPAADFARSLVLVGWPDQASRGLERFVTVMAKQGARRRDLDQRVLTGWVRVMAAARLDEGFTGPSADRLAALASGENSA